MDVQHKEVESVPYVTPVAFLLPTEERVVEAFNHVLHVLDDLLMSIAPRIILRLHKENLALCQLSFFQKMQVGMSSSTQLIFSFILCDSRKLSTASLQPAMTP